MTVSSTADTTPRTKGVIRVLIIEDRQDDAELMVSGLRRGGYGVDYVRVDTRDALASVFPTADWDLILADFSLPGFDAFGVLQEIHSAARAIPLIVVSGTETEEIGSLTKRAGAADFLLKSDLDRLSAIVDRELAGSSGGTRECLNKISVLIVEDVEDDLLLVVRHLESEKKTIQWTWATGIEEMKAKLSTGSWNLILCDYKLRSATGIEAIEFLKESHLDIPLILISGGVEEDVAASVLAAGAKDFINKNALFRLIPAMEREVRSACIRRKSTDNRYLHIQMARELAQTTVGLEEQAGLLREVLNSMTDAIFAFDNSGRVTLTNPAADACLKAIQSASPLFHGDGETPVSGEDFPFGLRNIQKKKEQIFALRESGSSETTFLSFQYRPWESRAGKRMGHLCVVRDITEHQKRQAVELQSTKHRLMGRFASGLAHDFNNVLTVIGGYTEIAIGRSSAEGRGRVYLDSIRTACHQASLLTSQLSAFSRGFEGQVRRVRMIDIVDSLRRPMQRVVGEGVEIVVRAVEPSIELEVDPARVQLVLLSLLTPSEEALGEIRKIEIGCTIEESGSVGISLVIIGNGDEKSRGMVTGDLEICRKLAESSGFTISTESLGPQEVRYTVGLSVAPAKSIESESSKGGESAIRILVVEDSDLLRSYFSSLLSEHGYQVAVCGSGAEAVAQMEAEGVPDLLLTDIMLPGMNGPEIDDWMRKKSGGAKTLFCSGYSEVQLDRMGIVRSSAPILLKPFDGSTLLFRVRASLNQ